MSVVKCFDLASMVLDEASSQFGVMWQVNKERERVLKRDCGVIDALATEFQGESLEVYVNDISMDITVSLVCQEVIVERCTHKLYSLLQRVKRFSVCLAPDGDNIQLNFVFHGIWDRAY